MLSRDLASDRVIRCQESGRGAMMVVVVFHRSGKRKSLCRECGAERWGGWGWAQETYHHLMMMVMVTVFSE